MLYPQNGDRIVTTDSVTSFHSMFRCVDGTITLKHFSDQLSGVQVTNVLEQQRDLLVEVGVEGAAVNSFTKKYQILHVVCVADGHQQKNAGVTQCPASQNNIILIIISISSPPHSFIPSFSANPSHRSLPFFFRNDYMDSPDCYTHTHTHTPI